MKRLFRTAVIALVLGAVAAPAFAEVKTRDKVTFKFESRLLKRQPNAAAALTNEFLPGEGLDAGTPGAP